MLQEPIPATPALSILMLRRDEQCCLYHAREKSALRQVREMEHLAEHQVAERQKFAPHEKQTNSNTRRAMRFIDDERAFDGGDVFIED